MNPEDCLKLADLIETDEEWYTRDFSDVDLIQALRAAATIDRLRGHLEQIARFSTDDYSVDVARHGLAAADDRGQLSKAD